MPISETYIISLCVLLHNTYYFSKGISTCNLQGPLLAGLEVASPLEGFVVPLIEEGLLLSGRITALATTTLQQTDYLFAGTDDGKLYQVLHILYT